MSIEHTRPLQPGLRGSEDPQGRIWHQGTAATRGPLDSEPERGDWHHGGVSKATSTQGSEGNLCRLLDGVI
jgi:hypothetical protein